LHELEWYRLGGGVSERQCHDVIGVIRVQGEALDWAYVARWSGALALDDLLARARTDAG
jgi:hypothetical protein